MSHAYELFYANHLLESKTEPCAGCFQALEDTEVVLVCVYFGVLRLMFPVRFIFCIFFFFFFPCLIVFPVIHSQPLPRPLTPVPRCQIAQVSPLHSSDPVLLLPAVWLSPLLVCIHYCRVSLLFVPFYW